MVCYETWLPLKPKNLPQYWENFQTDWVPAIKEKSLGRASGGLVLITNRASVDQVEVLEVSSWWIFAKITSNRQQLIIGGIYFNPTLDLEQALELLQVTLDELQRRFYDSIFIIGGDFNARLGEEDWMPSEMFEDTCMYEHRRSRDIVRNRRGQLIEDFMVVNGFVLLNGRAPTDCPANFTFCASTGNSVVDLAWVNSRGLTEVTDLKVCMEATLSDHFAITVSLKTQCPPENNNRLDGAEKTRTMVRWDPRKAQTFTEHLKWSEKIRIDFGSASIEEQNENLCQALIKAAKDSEMLKSTKSVKDSKHKRWFDRDCE